MQLTNDQIQAIDRGQAAEVMVDGRDCVLLRKDVYERVKSLLYNGDDITHDEMMALLAQSAEINGWNEPGMDDYDRYDELKK